MLYEKLYDHSLFLSREGEVHRKHSNAFAVNVHTGKDRIFGLKESVTPINKQQAAARTGLDLKYL